MSDGIPPETVGVFVAVLLYSIVCLLLCSVLVGLLISFNEKYTYVTIQTFFTSISTLFSIIQQTHFALQWRVIKQQRYDIALKEPGLIYIGGAPKVGRVLFLIQFWCYNTMALNILFWSIALFTSSWGFRALWLGTWHPRVGPISKLFAIFFPAIIVGLMQCKKIMGSRLTLFVIVNGTMSVALIAGSCFLVLTLYRYIKTRRLAAGGSRRGMWWASQSPRSFRSHSTTAAQNSVRNSIYDRALITRFTIGFVVLFFFLGVIIMFSISAIRKNSSAPGSSGPDLRPSGAKTDIILFIPGATASLVIFLVFGTTKSWQKYRDFLFGRCSCRGFRSQAHSGNSFRLRESKTRAEQAFQFSHWRNENPLPSSTQLLNTVTTGLKENRFVTHEEPEEKSPSVINTRALPLSNAKSHTENKFSPPDISPPTFPPRTLALSHWVTTTYIPESEPSSTEHLEAL